MKCDFHFHLENGRYGEGWFNQFLDEGKKRGIESYGVVEHIYNFKEFKNLFAFLSNHDRKGKIQEAWLDECNQSLIYDYISFVKSIKKKNRSVFLGIEMDYLPQYIKEINDISRAYDWDFIIGSIHMIDNWVIDNENSQDEWQYRDIGQTYKQYYEMIIDEINTGIFNIIGHIGNLKVYGVKDVECRRHYFERIAEAMRDKDVCIEINTGLIYRYPVREICPDFELLKICREKGVDITIASDAHIPEDIGAYHDYAVEYARKAGYTKQAVFIDRKKCLVELD